MTTSLDPLAAPKETKYGSILPHEAFDTSEDEYDSYDEGEASVHANKAGAHSSRRAWSSRSLHSDMSTSERTMHPRMLMCRILLAIGGCALLFLPYLIPRAKLPVEQSVNANMPRLGSSVASLVAQIPHEKMEQYYRDQLLDHVNPNLRDSKRRWSQRYFEDLSFFGGPGHPIFVIMGGEDPIDDILYPFISKHLGKRFSAYTMCVEHRFYGTSFPLAKPTNEDLKRLLSPHQALEDAARLIQHKQKELGCGPRGTPEYCPIMTVGASYPGFLASLLRFNYSHIVDIGYGSSTPFYLYSHDIDTNAYFERITEIADQASPGCAAAVKTALTEFQEHMLTTSKNFKEEAHNVGVCVESIPKYIDSNDLFQQEVLMVISAHFAENDMDYYPPGPDKELIVGCNIFKDPKSTSLEKVSKFLRMREGFEKCFDMRSELPPGPNGTISAADWTGVGTGPQGKMWDFQSCTLTPECSLSEKSMFPPRPYTIDWLTKHCQSRFNYTPNPMALVKQFGFDKLETGSRMLFTNGLMDGWSIASQLHDLSDSIKAINLVNGAHHSDITHEGPLHEDTWDVKAAHPVIADIIGRWLKEVRDEQMA